MTATLEPRASRHCYYDSFGHYRCYYTSWYRYGRWVVLGVILAIFVLTLLCLCFATRRRRRRGARPYYGTGWMARGVNPGPQYQQNQYNAPPGPPPQPYGGPQGGYGAYNAGPQQESGIAKPNPVYGGQQQGGGYDMYAPPPGPPPSHIR